MLNTFFSGNKHEPEEQPMTDKAAYADEVRLWVYALLDANTSTHIIPQMLRQRFGTKVVPNRSRVENMAIELGVLSNIQVCLSFYKHSNTISQFTYQRAFI